MKGARSKVKGEGSKVNGEMCKLQADRCKVEGGRVEALNVARWSRFYELEMEGSGGSGTESRFDGVTGLLSQQTR